MPTRLESAWRYYYPCGNSVKMLRIAGRLPFLDKRWLKAHPQPQFFRQTAHKHMMTHLINPRHCPARTPVRFALALFAVLLISACSVHKIDVQQGNVITQEMFEILKIGMGKQQVERVLGTPLVVDPFHRDRWDYLYYFRAGNTDETQSAHLSLYFESDQLSKIDVHSALPKEADVKKPGMALRR